MNNIRSFIQIWQTVVGKLNYIAFLAFVFTLPFPLAWMRPLWAIWLITWALEGRWLQPENYKRSKWLIPQLLICTFILWEAISLLWAENVSLGLHEIGKHVSLFAVLIISLIGLNSYYKPIHIKLVWIIGCFAAMAGYCLVNYAYQTDELIPQYYGVYWYNYLGSGPVMGLKHRTYFCLSLLIGLSFYKSILMYLQATWGKIQGAVITFVAMAGLCTGIVLTESRIGVIALVCLLLYAALATLKGWKRYALAAVICICSACFVLTSPRFQMLFTNLHLTEQQENMTRYFEEEYRPTIWTTALAHYKEYGLWGNGAGSSDEMMQRYYQQSADPAIKNYTFGPHNYYLQTWMELGIIGILLLLTIICATPLCCPPQVRKEAVSALICFALVMCVECIWSRMNAIYLLSAFLILESIETYRLTDVKVPLINR
ncbi:MAG: O-antigen ligase family protein [Paludibacteraceae bacterium]|nr:O-antigen ligase family protein [Paludibacteraceae bacterium]